MEKQLVRKIRFTILCNARERQLIMDLAKQLNRSQSDAIQLPIRLAMDEIVSAKQIAVPENLGGETGPAVVCAPPISEDA